MEQTTQAIILAAGRGTRMRELTKETPKPMLIVNGYPLLAHKILRLPKSITEVVLVVGYHAEVIREYFGASWGGRTMTYVDQYIANGTGGAILAARQVLDDRFIVMMGDDLYSTKDFLKACTAEWAIVVQKRKNVVMGGEILCDEQGNFKGIIEPRHHVTDGLVNTGLYAMKKKHSRVPVGSRRKKCVGVWSTANARKFRKTYKGASH